MATDVVFLLKIPASQELRDLDWPNPVAFISVEPDLSICEGVDPRCSTAYSSLWYSYGDLETFIRAKTKHIDDEIGRIAFVGYSAAFAFLAPALANPADRALVDAVLLIDASFGAGPKAGYVETLIDAANDGEPLIVSTTSNSGGTESWRASWEAAGLPTAPNAEPPPGLSAEDVDVVEDGAAIWLNWTRADGTTALPHWEQHKILPDLADAYLLPYYRGELSRGGGMGAGALLLGAAALALLVSAAR